MKNIVKMNNWASLDEMLKSRGADRQLSLPVKWRSVRNDHKVGDLTALERRALTLEAMEPTDIILTGYAVTWDDVYEIWPGYTESFQRGAFAEAMGDVRFLIEHKGSALAREDAGTVALEEDDTGLAVMVALDSRDTTATDLSVRIERGAIQGLSVGFTMKGGEETVQYGEDSTHYLITKVGKLWEFSAVSFPAYEKSSVEVAGGGHDEENSDDKQENSDDKQENSDDKQENSDADVDESTDAESAPLFTNDTRTSTVTKLNGTVVLDHDKTESSQTTIILGPTTDASENVEVDTRSHTRYVDLERNLRFRTNRVRGLA